MRPLAAFRVLLAILLLFSTSGAMGETALTGVEISPFVGYMVGGTIETEEDNGSQDDAEIRGSGDYGLFLDFVLNHRGSVGVMYSRQNTDLDSDPVAGSGDTPMRVEYFHVEGFYQWLRGASRPYVVASAGVTRLAPAGFDADSRLSLSIGGGVKYFPAEHFGFRLEGRYYGSLLAEDDEEFCTDDDEVCVVYNDNIILSQVDFKAGLVFAF